MSVQWSNWSLLEFLSLMRSTHLASGEARFKLAKADFTYDPSLGPSQFTEADFAGYAAVGIGTSPFASPALNGSGSGQMDGSTVTWTRSTTGASQTIYGWWLELSDGSEVIMAERITPTVSLVNAGEQIKITPQVLDCAGACS